MVTRTLLAVALCALGASLPPARAQEPSVAGASAVVTAIVGTAEIKRADAPGWEKAKPGDRLAINDWIRTAKASRATITMCGGTPMVLDADAQLRIASDCRVHQDRGRLSSAVSSPA